jgi:hypothetical protein
MPKRLRAVMVAFGIKSYPALAEIVGANKSSVSEWMRGTHLPRVPEMILLCEQTGLTLDCFIMELVGLNEELHDLECRKDESCPPDGSGAI